MKTLQEIGEFYKTDKAVNHPIHGVSHGFCPFYDYHLSSVRFDKIKLLEIGIFDGASLRMWEEYFPNAQIFGIDALLDSRSRLINEGRIQSFQINQEDIFSLTKLKNEYGPFDIVIDDGSHFTYHQFISWEIFKDSPIFIWEDLHTSRMPLYMTYKNQYDEYPLDMAKRLVSSNNSCFLFDKDNDEKHVTFLKKNK